MAAKKTKKSNTRPAALITGGALRFGRALALALAQEGYDIALHYHTSEKQAEKTRADIKKHGVKCEIYQADLSKPSLYAPLMAKVFKDFPALNVLVNSASIFEKGTLAETTESLLDRHMTINFKAPLFLTQHFAKKVRRGQVVNIVDSYITKDTTAYFAYLLSKKALHQFTRMAARELAPDIRVNAVAAGTTRETKNLDKNHLKHKLETLPMRRITTYDEIVAATMMVINADLTGQCVFVDAGEQLL